MEPCKLEKSYLVFRLMMMCCIVGLQTSLLLVLLCVCLIFFLSVHFIMNFFVKDFYETMQARVVTFYMQTVDHVLY